ncbi:MAG: hypothetical protein ACLTYW_04230 [Collinsella sp.]
MQRDASDTRVNPDLILKAIEKDEVADDTRTSRGHLKIFFGYAAGTGKTYAMLQAHAAKRRGVDVVAGYIEPHERPATAHLAQGLENVPCKLIEHNGIALSEFDPDAAIEAPLSSSLSTSSPIRMRRGLATTNAIKTSRNFYMGIDVYTTVNVQHIESLNDMVASITGVVVSERIPDRIFDDADQVELVDIERDLLSAFAPASSTVPHKPTERNSIFYRREPHRTPRNRAAPLRRSHRSPHRRRTRAGKP